MKIAAVREIIKSAVRDFDFTAQTSYLLSGMEREYFADLKAGATLLGTRSPSPSSRKVWMQTQAIENQRTPTKPRLFIFGSSITAR